MEHLTAAAAAQSEWTHTNGHRWAHLTNQPNPGDEYHPTHGLPVESRVEFGREGGLLEQAREMRTDSQDRIRDLEARVAAIEQRVTADRAEIRVEAASADGDNGARARYKTALDVFRAEIREELQEELRDEHQRVLRKTHDFYNRRLAEAATVREELEAKLRECVEKRKEQKRSLRAKRARILASSPEASKTGGNIHEPERASPDGDVDEDVKIDFVLGRAEDRANQSGFDTLNVPSIQHAFAEIGDDAKDLVLYIPSDHAEEGMNFESDLPGFNVPTTPGRPIE